MQCMKCGREIAAGRVFCESCLADMEKYPVKPGTPVHLPSRKAAPPAKKQPARRRPPLEEQVKKLKKRLWSVSIALTLALALLAGALYLAVDYIIENEGKPLPGQNYSSVESTERTTP